MANDGQIVFEITADNSDAMSEIRETTRAIQRETQQWEQASDEATGEIEGGFTDMLKNIAGAFTAAKIGQKLLEIGKEAINLASDLDEVQNVVDVTFGSAGASKIESWAKQAGTQFGLTETQAKRFTSTLGAMMKSSGLAGSEIVDMSTDLAGLAADMASFYNLDFDEAFQKIRSGISGETEPLKQLGINMSVANLNAYALQKGLTKTFDQMSQGEQVMLRYQYMMEATADAQGDFSRTSDEYANSVRKLETNVEQLKTALGKSFIDVVTSATGYLNKFMEMLMPDESKRTVLDDFASIDLNTESKIAQIQATAEQARELTEELERIGTTKADEAGKKVQGIVDGLSKIDLSNSKAQIVKEFVSTLRNDIDAIADIQGTSNEEAKKWLEGIGDAASHLSPHDAEGWKTLIDTIKTGLPGIENTSFGAKFFNSLNNLQIGEKAERIKQFISDLGDDMRLVQDLSGKDATDAKRWMEEIGAAADKLNPNDAAGWERLINTIKNDLPGIENTKLGAEFFNSFNNLKIGDKAQTIKQFIADLAGNMQLVQDLSGKDAESAKDWLAEIGTAADSLDPDDAQGWATLLDAIREGLPGLENTDFGKKFFDALESGFGSLKSESSMLDWAISNLGDKTDRTAEEQAYWLEICKRLVKTIPGLSSIINTETGEIKGGTQAVKDYIKAWEEGQTKLALLGALKEKESAIESRYADLPGLQLDMAVAEKRLRDRNKQLRALYDKYGYGEEFDKNNIGSAAIQNAILAAASPDDIALFYELINGYDVLKTEAEETAEKYHNQADELEEAKVALEEYRATIDEMPGAVEQAVSESEQYWIDNAENIKTMVNETQTAVSEMEDYVKGVHDAMLQTVNSVAKSLNGVDYQAYGKQIEKISELTQKQSQYEVGSEEWKKLQTEIDKANEGLVNTNNIYKNLESQATFLDEYLANMRKAREMGLSDELLSSLSDGSVESAEYLAALVNDKTGKSAAEIDELYKNIQEKKKALAKELGDQQLTVDQTYQSLAEKAKEAVQALDLEGEAKDNSGKTVAGIAQGIAEHIPEVAEAVDGIISELERLNGYGIDIDFGGFGNITFTTSTGKTEGSGRMGIPLVPHDDYIARLHEGERVLTAQENQIWNALRNGGVAGFDLETLGGVMRDNVHAGGNVYLDGRVVGSVLSDQQGRSYRQLQRSGWQA